MIVKFTVVIVYFMILFVVTRFLEFAGVLSRGMRCTEKWMDMQMLNTKNLRKVLDHRGISYRYVIERSELMSLVDISGVLTAGELALIDSQPTADDVLADVRYFHSAEQFVTSYVYPSVWLLQPLYYDNDLTADWALNDIWLPLLHTLQILDISTGQVNCTTSYKYCRQYNWTHSRPVLVRPYDTTFMFYESMTDSHRVSVDDVLDWLTVHLSQRVDIISSLSQLQHDWLDVTQQHDWLHVTQPVSVIICVNDTHVMPLFLAVLSVLLDRRVRFARVPLSIASQALTLPSHNHLTIVICTNQLTYVYGSGDADCMTMHAVRLLLTTLAPSAGDLLDFLITVCLLVVCVEPCLVSGLQSRLLAVVSSSLQFSCLFLVYCFFVSYVIPEHDLHLLLDDLLSIWRLVMLTSFGDLLRSDWLRYTTVHFNIFVVTYFLYVLLVAWLYRRLCRQRKAWLTWYLSTMSTVVDDDKDYIDWYTWQQFGLADYWLQSPVTSQTSCMQCHQHMSYGCKVCRLACQHVFHFRCLAQLVYSDESICPACHCPMFDNSDCSLHEATADGLTVAD